jgi:hypothetical protein
MEGFTFVVLPPFVESMVGTNVEALFWGRSLGKCIAHVRTEDKEILRGGHSVEETGAGLIYTVGIDFVKNLNRIHIVLSYVHQQP